MIGSFKRHDLIWHPSFERRVGQAAAEKKAWLWSNREPAR